MQRCKSAYGLCKGVKLNTKIGRGVASPRPCLHRRSRRSLAPTRERSSREATRLARSANPTRGRAIPYPPNTNRYPPPTARSANPTRGREKRGTGDRDVGRRTDATQSRPYLEAVRLGGLTTGGFGGEIINIIPPTSGWSVGPRFCAIHGASLSSTS